MRVTINLIEDLAGMPGLEPGCQIQALRPLAGDIPYIGGYLNHAIDLLLDVAPAKGLLSCTPKTRTPLAFVPRAGFEKKPIG